MDFSGLVQTVTLGTTTITATCSVVSVCGSINGSTNVIVTAAVLQSIQVSPNEPSIALGLTQQFTATGLYGDGTHQDVTGSVTWASASTSVATVSNSNGSSGLATSVGVGTTNIVAVLGSVASPCSFYGDSGDTGIYRYHAADCEYSGRSHTAVHGDGYLHRQLDAECDDRGTLDVQ